MVFGANWYLRKSDVIFFIAPKTTALRCETLGEIANNKENTSQ